MFPVSLPNGITYFGRSTGRASDGRLVVDFVAQAFGLPLLPPYLAGDRDFRQGANFAVSGVTAMDPSFFTERNLGGRLLSSFTLNAQVEGFEKLKPSLCHSPEDCRSYFSKSLFLVGEIGVNDYNILLTMAMLPVEQVQADVPRVVQTIARATQRLIDLGAVNLVVPGIVPIGCTPLYLTKVRSSNSSDYDVQTGCLRKFNDFAEQHNALLIQALQKLREKNRHAKIAYADYYSAILKINSDPTKFGFVKEVLRACCGGGGGAYNFDTSAFCGSSGTSVCDDPGAYLSWDGFHYTEAGNRYIAEGLLNGPYANPPIMHPKNEFDGDQCMEAASDSRCITDKSSRGMNSHGGLSYCLLSFCLVYFVCTV